MLKRLVLLTCLSVQVKKLVQKVIARDSLHYRKLTDKPKDDPSAKQNGIQAVEDLNTLGLGNINHTILLSQGIHLNYLLSAVSAWL